MAGNASDIALASNAMLLLGANTISSFTDGSSEAQVASNLYEHSYKFILASHRWRFAVKQEKLARLTKKPEAVYDYQFQLPTDLLYLIRPIDSQRYEVYGDKIYSNSAEMVIEFVYTVDAGLLPSYFAKAMEYYLAFQFAVPITGDLAKASFFEEQYNKAIIKAKFLDSSARPNQPFRNNRYTDVRIQGSYYGR